MSEPRHIRTTSNSDNHSGERKVHRSTAQSADTRHVRNAEHAQSTQPHAGRRRKKKTPMWLPFVVVLGVIVVLGGAAIAVVMGYASSIMDAVHDDNAASIAQEVQTLEAYKGDVANILICGIDYEEGRSYGSSNDGLSNDGMTDMIMYFQFDLKNSKVNMLQIPRNTVVGKTVTCSSTTGKTYKASNGQINSIMKSNSDGMAALADVIANNYKLPVDHYATMDMDGLKELVNRYGGVDCYIPTTISYNGSTLEQGYHRLMGDQVEFLVRDRHSYADGDISRMNMQRYFYSALFKKVRTENLAGLVKAMPVITYFVKTDMDLTTCVQLAYAFLSVDSADIMIAQTPVYTAAEYYEGNSVIIPARAEIASLLNTYYREYTGQVDASSLNLKDDLATVGSPTSANVQMVGQLDAEANAAIEAGQTDLPDAYTTDNAPSVPQ